MTNEQIDWTKFKESQKDKQKTIDHLLQKVVEGNYEERSDQKTTKQSLFTKRRNGLFSIGRTDLFNKMDQCSYGDKGKSKFHKVCGNVYCKGCRNSLSYLYYCMLYGRIESGRWVVEDLIRDTPLPLNETYQKLVNSEYTNDDLLHITGVCGLSTLRPSDIQKVMSEDQKKWRKIRYNIDKLTTEHYWIECVYEFELVNWNHLKFAEESDYKKKQIKQLIDSTDQRFLNEPFLFIHFHGITNVPRDKLNDVFGYLYFVDGKRLVKTSKETGLYVQKLHSNKSLDENIRKMCSYPFKDPYRYKHSFRGNDFLNGESFTDNELGRMIELYDHIGGRGHRKFFRSVSNELVLWERVYNNIELELQHQTKRYKRMKSERHRLLPFILTLHRCLSEIRKPKNGRLRKRITNLISETMRECWREYKGSFLDVNRLTMRYQQLKWEVDDKLFHRRKFQWNYIEPNKSKSQYNRHYKTWIGQKEVDQMRDEVLVETEKDYNSHSDLTKWMS